MTAHAINAARAALLLIWPDGDKCQHNHARSAFVALDAAEKREAALVSALESMCHQYLRVEGGKLHHDFMSAGEEAFEALEWDDDGHPVDAEGLCEVPGCGQAWSCGVFGNDDKYHCLCGDHYREFKDAGRMETTEQAMARHAADLRHSMHFEQAPAVHILMNRWKLTAEQATALWDQATKAPPYAVIEAPAPANSADIENELGG